jgi:hypothetical protein
MAPRMVVLPVDENGRREEVADEFQLARGGVGALDEEAAVLPSAVRGDLGDPTRSGSSLGSRTSRGPARTTRC